MTSSILRLTPPMASSGMSANDFITGYAALSSSVSSALPGRERRTTLTPASLAASASVGEKMKQLIRSFYETVK